MAIYVEIHIRAPLDRVWDYTQTPRLHERWDLRFTEISYLPRKQSEASQGFLYTTRLGFGIRISGCGESTGQRNLPDGSSASALTFGSSDVRSLIMKGSGYWKYIPTDSGVRFVTAYDYRTRFGRFGKFVDQLAFRPLIGWATAWSFDRLRLWLERGIEPSLALRHALIHGVTRWALALVFIYQGTFPKVLGHNILELSMLSSLGIPANVTPIVLVVTGMAEILFGLCILIFWRSRVPAIMTLVLTGLATAAVTLAAPSSLAAAFNPVSLNLAVAGLAIIDLLTKPEWTPTASRCLRIPPPNNS